MLKILKVELERLKMFGGVKSWKSYSNKVPGIIHINGKMYHDFTSWDYFNCASNGIVTKAWHQAIDDYGLGMSGARLVGGTSIAHDRCESRLANFFGGESALIFSSRNQVIVSFVSSIFSQSDFVIYEDSMALPVGDACFLGEIPCASFASDDLTSLDRELAKASQFGNRIVFVESLNGVTGKMINWSNFSEICARHGASIVVDESFAAGIVGIRGAGLSEMLHKTDLLAVLCDLKFGFGGTGSVMVTAEIVKDLVVSRSNYFQTDGYPAAFAAGIVANVDFVELQHLGRESLKAYRQELVDGLMDMKLDLLDSPDGAFCTIGLDSYSKAKEISAELFRRGFLVEVCPGKKPYSENSIMRLVLNKGHSSESIRLLLGAMSELRSHGEFYS